MFHGIVTSICSGNYLDLTRRKSINFLLLLHYNEYDIVSVIQQTRVLLGVSKISICKHILVQAKEVKTGSTFLRKAMVKKACSSMTMMMF
jgi:hypothetical protein